MDTPTSTDHRSSARERASVAGRIAQDVVSCDSAILSLLVLDLEDGSEVLAVARSARLPREEYATPLLVRKFGIAAAVVWGAAESAAQLLGRREFIIGAFREQLVLMIGLREYDMLLAVRLSRSSNAEHIYAKIASLLGIG